MVRTMYLQKGNPLGLPFLLPENLWGKQLKAAENSDIVHLPFFTKIVQFLILCRKTC